MTEKLTKDYIENLQKRAEDALATNPYMDVDGLFQRNRLIGEDIPKLLAEIERLRDLYEKPKTEFERVIERLADKALCPHCHGEMFANHYVEPGRGRIFGYTCGTCVYNEWDGDSE